MGIHLQELFDHIGISFFSYLLIIIIINFFSFLFATFVYRKVYALNVVGVIPDELWNLTSLFNLYVFIFFPLSADITYFKIQI